MLRKKTLSKIGLGLRPPKFIESLPSNDPYRQRILGELAETFQLHADDAAAAAAGTAHRCFSSGFSKHLDKVNCSTGR